MSSFKESFSLEKRVEESTRILLKHPTRIPIIVENSEKSKLIKLDRKKYLIPKNLQLGQFLYIIRKKITLPSDQAMFMFFNNTLLPTSMLMSEVYSTYKDIDQFLYGTIYEESTYG